MDPVQIAQQQALVQRQLQEQAQKLAASLGYVYDKGAAQMQGQGAAINAALATVQQVIQPKLTRQQQQIQLAMNPIQAALMQQLQQQQQQLNTVPLQALPQHAPPAPPNVPLSSPEPFNLAMFGDDAGLSGGLDASMQAPTSSPAAPPPPQTGATALDWVVFCGEQNTLMVEWGVANQLAPQMILYRSRDRETAQAWADAHPDACTRPPPPAPTPAEPQPPPRPPAPPVTTVQLVAPPPPPPDPQLVALIDYACHCLCQCLKQVKDPVDLDQPLAFFFGERTAKWHQAAFAWIGIEENFVGKYPNLQAMVADRPGKY